MKIKDIILNKYRSILFIASIGLCLNSCVKDDLLNLNDPGGVDGDKAWTTDYITRVGMNGIYATLRYGIDAWGASGRELYQLDRFVTTQWRDPDPYLNGGMTPGDGLFKNTWKDMYEGIGRANDAIINIPEKSQSSEKDKARFIAEAKFMRAYFYFRLNQVFKGVPIYDELINDKANLTKARNTETEVWEFILKDLNDAINESEFPDKYPANDANYGKATKGAAYALRGKVYLYMKKYEEAVKDFDSVKSCGFGLFQGNYKQLFKEVNEQCEEMIFSIQHIGVPNYGSQSQFYLGPRTTINGGGWGTYQITPYIVDLHDNLDGSQFNWNDVIPGYNEMNPDHREVYFLRDIDGLEEEFIANGLSSEVASTTAASIRKKVNDKLNSYPTDVKAKYLSTGNEARIKKAYENRDPRLGYNVVTPYSSFLGASKSNEDFLVYSRWPYQEDLPGINDLRTDMTSYFYYMHRKFVYEGVSESPNREYGPIDFPILRYGDVLLMKAEALNELGQTEAAIAVVNEVRKRAGVGLLNSSPKTMVAGQDDLRKRIQNERRIELVGEGVSFFDELRWNTLKETTFNKVQGSKQIWGSIVYPYTWTDKITSWAIPLEEIQMNSNLTQNPNWGN